MHLIIVYVLYLLTALVPLIFTTINSELFEFPKFIILLSSTLVIASAWAVDYFHNKNKPPQLKIVNWSVVNYAIVAILITQALATITSIHPYTSFWGYYTRYHQGLATTICYTIIYFAAHQYLVNKSTQKIIKISVITSFFISLYAILERLGIDKTLWVQDVQNRVFSTLGQPNWLAAYLLPNIFLTLYLLQRAKNISPLHYFVFATLSVALLFTKSRSGFLAFGFSYLTYWLLLARQFSFARIKTELITYSLLLILPLLIFGTPFTPSLFSLKSRIWNLESSTPPTPDITTQGTALENGGTESGDIRKIVWTGALDLIKKYPLLGTGPETFAYTYYWARPIAHNLTSEWDFLYNKAHNEYLNIAAGSGMVGLLAYLYFHYAVFSASFTLIPKSKKINQDQDDDLRHFYPVLGASIVAFAVTNFFGFSVIPVYLTMTFLATFPTTMTNQQSSSPISYLLSPIFILFLLYPANLFLADLAYANGKKLQDAGSHAKALPLFQKATAARPGLDLFHSALAETYGNLGQTELAIQEVNTLYKQNPYHLNFYKVRAKVYLTLASNTPSYYTQAALELKKARGIAPSDPKLAYNLALVYTRMGQNDEAAKQLEDAIVLKPNYESPYYALTLLYEQTKQADKIPPLLDDMTSRLSTYSPQLKDKIEKYIPAP